MRKFLIFLCLNLPFGLYAYDFSEDLSNAGIYQRIESIINDLRYAEDCLKYGEHIKAKELYDGLEVEVSSLLQSSHFYLYEISYLLFRIRVGKEVNEFLMIHEGTTLEDRLYKIFKDFSLDYRKSEF